MIRINLAPGTERKTKAKDKAGPSIATGALTGFLLPALLAGLSLVACGALWWLQSNKLRDLQTRIAADEKRQKDLEAIKQQVDQFQMKKATLENKILVIEQLRLSQKSPVHMLDEISKALPDYVWLSALDDARGSLRFTGQSNSLAAVADFMGGLQRSGWFPQVDLGTSVQQQNLINFTLTGTFKDPEVAAKEKAAADAKAAAAPPPPAKGPRGKK